MMDASTSHFSVCVAEFARQLGQGEMCALAKLYDYTASRLLRYAETLTRNREDAEDALQAAMVRMTLRPKALAGADHPWPYFLKVVRNEALKILRKKRAACSLATVAPIGVTESCQLDQQEANAQIRAAIRELPPAQGEVVVLKIWEGMTFLEIAEVLGESPNTAASRYRYALEKLTHLLQPMANEVTYA
ncbi:ECF RNA polymerase sigma factor SigL [Symmachiella macrocystis]|uniref:ECF RNA polymerase sigma factor SigL n=1 Tax=Symmachiella macrocystis TaxID=2527985 RepID=A0A5C6BNC1_9PLAN|nr:sigma-70 family RNA polymerase sigma factor [Symmachiella macrocystis]TWU12931.1 ECF RNA polymerase sigma factor SigL [Symmachiella macrocystis]